MTPREVAEWMLQQQGGKTWLDQESIVYKIHKECGSEHTYTNGNGNLAISKEVLKEWRKLTEDTHVWDRGSRGWRLRTNRDPAGVRQVE